MTAPPPDAAVGLLSLSDAAAQARHIPPTAPVPIPIPAKPRPRSSFSQANRRRRPSDARDPLVVHEDRDRDRAASARLLSKSAPLDEAPLSGKKKGAVFRCESCAKIYRHPSCLVKHRWEHSPHWREASKFLLSKHQQVQLLEAAAILSHLSPTTAGGGTSLPEDRSLWPAYLSGGRLPPALTQFRPGLLGHPNPTPDDAWVGTPHTSIDAPFASPRSVPAAYSHMHAHAHSPGAFSSGSVPLHDEERSWSLPRSSVRGGESDDDGARAAMEGVEDDVLHAREHEREHEPEMEEWDGMEMEMEI